MKKILFAIMVSLILASNVFAETHDVKAKYEKNYNVDLIKTTLNNNTQEIKLDEYEITLSTPLKNVEVILIKPDEEVNNYIKTITNNIDNYYLSFYQNNQKITSNNINIEIKSNGKNLKIFDNKSNQIEVINNKANLTSNDYYFTVSNLLAEIRDDYKIIDVNTIVHDIEDIEINNDTNIQVFNSKNQLLDNTKVLGTGYKVILNTNNNITEHNIVVKGDTTGDAKINLNDITRLYHYYKLIESMTDAYVLAGDVATNNVINLNDITKIYHYHKKFISDL